MVAEQTAVFQITVHKKYRELKEFESALSKLSKAHPKLSREQLLLEGDEALLIRKQMAEAEVADNDLEERRRLGDPVIYGQPIQLLHTHSHKYVFSSSSQTSKLEPSNMRVTMQEHSAHNTWFRIMPRYKVRAEGDNVRVGDQIVVESLKTPGQFLHAGDTRIPQDIPDAGRHEINLSVIQTSFTLNLYSKPRQKSQNNVYGGDVVQLFHKVGHVLLRLLRDSLCFSPCPCLSCLHAASPVPLEVPNFSDFHFLICVPSLFFCRHLFNRGSVSLGSRSLHGGRRDL